MMIKCCLLLLQHIFNQLHLSKWICPVEKKKEARLRRPVSELSECDEVPY